MTDLEITRLCAESMDLDVEFIDDQRVWIGTDSDDVSYDYAPLTDDAQCMALGKSDPVLFSIVVREWAYEHLEGRECDLNRLACTAFAVQQQARKK